MIEVSPLACDKTYMRTNIQFQNKDATAEIAQRLLAPFQKLIHGNQRVNIQHAPLALSEQVQDLVLVMSPRAVWVNALAWYALQGCQKDLAEAREALEAGDLENAIERYAPVRCMSALRCFFGLPQAFYHSKTGIPIAFLCFCIFDAGVTELNLCVRLGGTYQARIYSILEGLDILMGFIPRLPEALQEIIKPVSELKLDLDQPLPGICCVLWCGEMIDPTEDRLHIVLHHLQVAASQLQGDPYFDHDLKLVKALYEDQDVSL